MIRRPIVLLAVLATAASSLSCAVTGGESGPYAPRSMPAARAALPPVYRVFYDELAEYGDWVLIEPYGFVFRPRVSFVSWRPYFDGWWQPSDVYGWVWISDEPFGWITYHYGNWFYDRFQGWVWLPGYDWGPAWVAWVAADDWFGWAPLGPTGYEDYGRSPGGLFTFVPARMLASARAERAPQFVTQVAPQASTLRPILEIGVEDGVASPRGPRYEAIERALNVPVKPASIEIVRPRVERGGAGPRADEAAVIALTQRVVAAGEREFAAARDAGASSATPPATPRPPVWREPSRPEKPRVGPLGAPDTTAPKLERRHAPDDSAAAGGRRGGGAPRDAGKRDPRERGGKAGAAARDSVKG